MKLSGILKNILTSIFLGIILGAITEYALIIELNWLINITQSYMFWGLIICITALLSKDYWFSLINPALIMLLMDGTYYLIRLILAGYTNIYAFEMFALMGVAGSIYLGNLVSLIKGKIFHDSRNKFLKINNLIFMTTLGNIFAFNITIRSNSLYNTGTGMILGFILSTILYIFYKHNKIDKKLTRRNLHV